VDFVDGLQQPDPRVAARICSINKILATIDGGLLYLYAQPARQLQHCNWYEELKGVAFLLKIPQLMQRARRRNKASVNVKVKVQGTVESAQFKYFRPSDLTSAGFRHTKLILQCSNF